MKNILILYAAYGGGHLNAATAIKDYIEKNYEDVNVDLVDCIKYISKSIDKVTTSAYKELAKTVPWAWEKMYYKAECGMLSKISSSTNKILSLKLKNLFEIFNPDLVISTHPFASQMTCHLKKKRYIDCKLATILTDFASHKQWLIGHEYTDYFFVSNDTMVNELIDFGINKEKIFNTGIPISLKFSTTHNKNDIFSQFGLKQNKKLVLFFGGGEFGLGKSKTISYFDDLLSSIPKVQVIAVSGKNKKIKYSFQEIVNKYHRQNDVKLLEFTPKIPEIMSISDFVISKPGGLTTSESLFSNLPMIIINPIPGQEEKNAEFLENNNLGIWVKKDDNLPSILQDLINSENKINELKFNTKRFSNRNSSKNICDILFKETNI